MKRAIYVAFDGKRVKATRVKAGEKISTVKYLEKIDISGYKAKKGETRRVYNKFITERAT